MNGYAVIEPKCYYCADPAKHRAFLRRRPEPVGVCTFHTQNPDFLGTMPLPTIEEAFAAVVWNELVGLVRTGPDCKEFQYLTILLHSAHRMRGGRETLEDFRTLIIQQARLEELGGGRSGNMPSMPPSAPEASQTLPEPSMTQLMPRVDGS